MHTNPFFDPNPEWLFNVLKAWCFIALLITVFGIYLILLRSPGQSETYKKLILYHLLMGMMFELDLTVLSPPLLYLPYVAAEGKGFWSEIGCPPDIQFALLITLIGVSCAAICPLFYYRMDVLLPENHALNKNCIRYTVYIAVIVFCYVAFFPLIYLAMNYEPQELWKGEVQKELNVSLENFNSPSVLVIKLYGNPWAQLLICCIVIGSMVIIEIVFGCTYIIYHEIQLHTNKLSIQTKKYHTNMLRSLLALMLVISSIAAVFVPVIIWSFYLNNFRADFLNIVLAIGGGIFPVGVVAYIMSYTPYRNIILGVFIRRKKVRPMIDETKVPITFTIVKETRRQTLY